MEDVLDLYHEAHDPERPVVCFDESSVLTQFESGRDGPQLSLGRCASDDGRTLPTRRHTPWRNHAPEARISG